MARDGVFLRIRSTGRVYRVAGRSPIRVTSWAPFGGPQPVVTLDTFEGQGLRHRPLDGTFITGAPGGRVYRIAGGAPVHVSSWTPFGGPQPSVVIDQWAIDHPTTLTPHSPDGWGKLGLHPVDGTVLLAAGTHDHHLVRDGGPLPMTPSWVWTSPPTPVAVDPKAIASAGGAAPWNNLRKVTAPLFRALPAESTVDIAVGTTLTMVLRWPSSSEFPTAARTRGRLPQGVSSDREGLHGSPRELGSFDVELEYADALGRSSTMLMHLRVHPPARAMTGPPQPGETVQADMVDGAAPQVSSRAAISADGSAVAFLVSSVGVLMPDESTGKSSVVRRDVATGRIDLVDVASDETPADGFPLDRPSLDADGSVVAFSSRATNLTPGDVNGTTDVFVRDLDAGTTTAVSVTSSGAPGNGESTEPSVSADGRYVAFRSTASNLVPGDDNGRSDVFVRDLLTGVTTLVSVAADGGPGNHESSSPSISADGRRVAFVTRADDLFTATRGRIDWHAVVRDLPSGRSILATRGPDGTPMTAQGTQVAISGDGHSVAVACWCQEVWTTGPARRLNVFVHDLESGVTRAVARASALAGSLAMSADGGVVAWSDAESFLAGSEAPVPFRVGREASCRVLPDPPIEVCDQPGAKLHAYDLRTDRPRLLGLDISRGIPETSQAVRLSADGRLAVVEGHSVGGHGTGGDPWAGGHHVHLRDLG